MSLWAYGSAETLAFNDYDIQVESMNICDKMKGILFGSGDGR